MRHRRGRQDTRGRHDCRRRAAGPRYPGHQSDDCIGPDETRIDGEAFATEQILGHAAFDRRFEQLAQQVAVAEAAMAVFRDGRMVGHIPVEPQSAEPAIGKVQMHLVAQPTLGTDPHAVTDNEHPDHQRGVDRWPSHLAVERLQMLADARQVHEPVV